MSAEPDLDADGTPDLLWSAQGTPSLLAMSGADGSVLWLFPPPDTLSVATTWEIVGMPIVSDVDDDGVSDVIGVLASRGEPMWFEAVSGTSGRSIWKYELDELDYDEPFGAPLVQPQLVTVGDRSVATALFGRHLVGIDVTTGQPAWQAHDLGGKVVRAPLFGDLDGDGADDLVVSVQTDCSPVPVPFADREEDLWTPARIAGISLGQFRSLWDRKVGGRLKDMRDSEWICVGDVDDDGKSEVAIVNHRLDQVLTVDLLDGATGKSQWPEPHALNFAPLATEAANVHRILLGPDFDRDSCHDLVVVSNGYVDLISGENGRTLSWYRSPRSFHGSILSADWWPATVVAAVDGVQRTEWGL